MYSLTFRVRVATPAQYGRNGTASLQITSQATNCTCNHGLTQYSSKSHIFPVRLVSDVLVWVNQLDNEIFRKKEVERGSSQLKKCDDMHRHIDKMTDRLITVLLYQKRQIWTAI